MCNVNRESMEVATHHFTRGPKSLNPKYDMDVYMVALFGVCSSRCVCNEYRVEQKVGPNLHHKSLKKILHKLIKI